MIIDYISDLHIDFWLGRKLTEEEFIGSYIYEDIFKKANGEILIIAGDLGHYNEQNVIFLNLLLEFCKYKHIFFVLGNHDYYLFNEEWSRFKGNSFNRVEALKDLLRDYQKLTLLDGEVYNYNGIHIGGCSMWYDGQYREIMEIKLTNEQILELWQAKVTDSMQIGGISHYLEMFKKEIIKLDKIYKKSDIIITHVNPSILPEHTAKEYSNINSPLNCYYSFDGINYTNNTSAKYWIFGHIHHTKKYKIGNLNLMCNPLGYPSQNEYPKLKSFNY